MPRIVNSFNILLKFILSSFWYLDLGAVYSNAEGRKKIQGTEGI